MGILYEATGKSGGENSKSAKIGTVKDTFSSNLFVILESVQG